jgi:hypothetical protein
MVHFFTNTNYDLHRDSFLYLAQGDHLAFGYASVPPLVAVLGKITRLFFGNSVFVIRLFPALAGAISVIIIALIVKSIHGKIWAIGLACTAYIISPAFLRSNTLFQPVTFNQFFWLLIIYFVVKLIQSENTKYWIYLGFTSGLAFLNKYSVVFLILALIFSIWLTPHRKLLFSRHFSIGVLIGFLFTLPNLIWQYSNNWPVVSHMLTLQQTQLVNVNMMIFILMQLLMNFPSMLIWIFGLIYLLFFKAAHKYRVLGYTYLILILILILLRGKHYYTLGIYPVLFATGGFAVEKYFTGKLNLFKPIMLLLMVMFSLPIIPYSLPVLSHDAMLRYVQSSNIYRLQEALRWEDGQLHSLPQDYADMIGWKELADIVIQTYNSLSKEEKAHCAIFTENYGEAGAIKYYTKKQGLPEPISFSDSFLFWAPDYLNITCLIYVASENREISNYFEKVTLMGRIKNKHSRESGLPVYLCKGPKNGFLQFYARKVKQLKDQFQ